MITTVGTCSICGGAVQVPAVWGGVIPPVPTCSQCGATAAAHGPIIPMRPTNSGANVFIKFAQPATSNEAANIAPSEWLSDIRSDQYGPLSK